jgi:hypothetical protein
MRRPRSQVGFAALPSVTLLALLIILSLTLLFRHMLINQDEASFAQLNLDYQQREDSLMRAIVAIFPGKAIACMKADHAESEEYSWKRIFSEAVTLSAASERLSPELVESLGVAASRSADVGGHSSVQVESWITSLSGVADRVTPGTAAFASVFSEPAFAGKVPPRLAMSQALQEADAVRPIVSLEKQYGTQDSGLLADVTNYPLYNLIPYPNMRFGYAAPGQPFVAKHNWWAFTVNYGNSARSLAKNYILSLYEIPSQMPIEASTFASIGRHEDGTTWSSSQISIDGTIYAKQLAVEGSFGASRLAGGSSIDITDSVSLGGVSVSNSFDALGVREQLQADNGSDSLPVALAANSGRLAFLPIQPGSLFLQRPPSSPTPTTWQNYAIGAQRCAVTVEALSMVSYENQTPVRIRVRFLSPSSTAMEVILERGNNWPNIFEAGGDVIPFQTELTDSNRSCLTFRASLFSAWLQTQAGGSTAINSSIHISTATAAAGADATVREQTASPTQEDMCVILRSGKDLSDFTRGLSVVSPLRVYVGDDLNDVAVSAPSGSGLPSGSEFYPPMSIFAAEVRVGTTSFTRPIEVIGQLGTLVTGGTSNWKPLDIKSGADDAVHAEMINAQLAPLRSPAELPPVHQMNWLVVIEEILSD